MPIVAILDGVKIVFHANEHPPPHFHARIAEHEAVIDIDDLVITRGFLPKPKARKAELRRAFHAAIALEPVEPIE